MINNGANALVIAAVDGSAFTEVLATAKEQGIIVIAYDRMIMNSGNVDYYATFDNLRIGQIQGQYIVDRLDVANQAGPFNIEVIAGDPGDSNAHVYFNGAMGVLQPYLDSGRLVIRSGQTTMAQAATPKWSTEEAQRRIENIITAVGYGPNADNVRLSAVLAANDDTARGTTNALLGAGFVAGPDFPIITGQDADRPSVKNIKAGTQAMSIFKDTRALALSVVDMLVAIRDGNEVTINDTTSYNNGVRVLPAFLLSPVVVEQGDIQRILIDSGYYTMADIS
jgi:putative multiple sugar transport system substrate-binding protein